MVLNFSVSSRQCDTNARKQISTAAHTAISHTSEFRVKSSSMHASSSFSTLAQTHLHVGALFSDGDGFRAERFWRQTCRSWEAGTRSRRTGTAVPRSRSPLHVSMKWWVLDDGNWLLREQRFARQTHDYKVEDFSHPKRKFSILPSQTYGKVSSALENTNGLTSWFWAQSGRGWVTSTCKI